ncbi:MAG: RAD55 family ATPase [Chloroflexota bacterium]
MAVAHDGGTPPDSLATGIPNLDRVLGGGLPRGTLVLVLGPPGSGKTILSSQIAFAAAQRGQRVLLLTALSEPTTKLVAHLRSYRFFAEGLLGTLVRLISLQDALDRGLPTTEQAIIEEVRRSRAEVVVIDGFRGVRGASEQPAREFLYDVGTTLGLQGVTTLVTSESDPRDPAFFPETTTADVIIGLYFDLVGVRQQRGLEVVKVRGAAPLPGRHALALSEDGATVYPRLETRVLEVSTTRGAVSGSVSAGHLAERAAFDMPELDALLGGGVNRGTGTLVAGALGAGKTLLALHFALAGVRAGESVLYLGFRETAEQLQQKADSFALGPQWRAGLAAGGGLRFLRWEPVELDADVVADQLLATIEQTAATRLIVDSIAELERAVLEANSGERVANFMAALLAVLRLRGVTMLGIREAARVRAAELDYAVDPVSVLAENVLHLQQMKYRGELRRVLSVVKMRFSAYDPAVREFRIVAPEGIRVLGRFESGLDVLVGLAEQQEGLVADMSGQQPPGKGIAASGED